MLSRVAVWALCERRVRTGNGPRRPGRGETRYGNPLSLPNPWNNPYARFCRRFIAVVLFDEETGAPYRLDKQ